MKNILRLVACCLLLAAFQLRASTLPNNTTKFANENTATFVALPKLTAHDLLTLTPEQYRLQTGKKLSLEERISLRMVKKSIRKHLKQDETFVLADVVETEKFKFRVGAFFLGFFLGLIGFLISLAFRNRRDAMISAAIGWGLAIVIVLTLLV